jgi:hypothetical protein
VFTAKSPPLERLVHECVMCLSCLDGTPPLHRHAGLLRFLHISLVIRTQLSSGVAGKVEYEFAAASTRALDTQGRNFHAWRRAESAKLQLGDTAIFAEFSQACPE